MSRFTSLASVLALAAAFAAHSGEPASKAGHYLFAWSGDSAGNSNDFMAVIDADPDSASYGHLVTTIVTDQKTMQVHHSEYTMPESGYVFANDHAAGRTFIFNVKDPLRPAIVTSFADLAGFEHPHSFLRLPNGHVLATFQHMQQHHGESELGSAGGLVEIDDLGHVIRSVSAVDPAFPDALLMPYSLVVLPEIDRVLVTNSSMHEEDAPGHTYQIFRLSDLKLLKTAYFDTGGQRFGDINPEEPRRGPDGSVYVQTLACGIERVSDIATAKPKSQLVYVFPGGFCGVPTIVGHYLIQSVFINHSLIAVDIANPTKPVEVSRLRLDDVIYPHWTGWDAKTSRLVVTGYGEHRMFIVKFDQVTGALHMDTAFHDADGKSGFNFDTQDWPDGWKGSANAHGVVFSR